MVVAENKRREKTQREYEPTPQELPRKKASQICSASQMRANRSDLSFNLDPEYIQMLWKTQNAKCWYSGLFMKISKNKVGFFSPSLDKLDPNLGYIKGNVVLCLFAVNSFKQELIAKDFIDLLASIKWRQSLV